MTLEELEQACKGQVELIPEGAHITLILSGSLGYGRTQRRKRLWKPDGPLGEPYADAPKGGVLVSFDAQEVLDKLQQQKPD